MTDIPPPEEIVVETVEITEVPAGEGPESTTGASGTSATTAGSGTTATTVGATEPTTTG